MKEFTIDQGLNVQQDQLKRWKPKLNENLYKDLEAWCQEDASKGLYRDGYDVPRGNTFDNFIGNWEPPKAKTIAFNTGRHYTDKGQRIAAMEVMGGVYMVDIDRGLDYWYPDTPCTKVAVLNRYDNNMNVWDPEVSDFIRDNNLRQQLEELARTL